MKRSHRNLAWIALLILVLTACGGGDGDGASQAETAAAPDTAPETEAAADLEQTSISVAIGPDPAFATHAVAIDKGYFEEEGITEVDTQTFASGVEAGQSLAAGDIDLWNPGNLPPITLIANGAPIKVIGNNAVARVEHLMAHPDAGITNPEDLEGARIAVLQGSTQAAFMANLAEHYGLDMSAMDIVNLTPPEALTALRNQDVDAAVLFPPMNFQAAEEFDAKLLAGTESGFESDNGESVDFSRTRNIFVIPESLEQQAPNTTEAMMRALLRAQAWVADPANEQEAQEIYSEFNDQALEATQDAWPLYEFTPELDESYVSDMENYSSFLESIGALRGEAPDVSSYTDSSYVEELAP